MINVSCHDKGSPQRLHFRFSSECQIKRRCSWVTSCHPFPKQPTAEQLLRISAQGL